MPCPLVPGCSSIAGVVWGGRRMNQHLSLPRHRPLPRTPKHTQSPGALRPASHLPQGVLSPSRRDVWPRKSLLLSCLAAEMATGLKSEHLVIEMASVLPRGEENGSYSSYYENTRLLQGHIPMQGNFKSFISFPPYASPALTKCHAHPRHCRRSFLDIWDRQGHFLA